MSEMSENTATDITDDLRTLTDADLWTIAAHPYGLTAWEILAERHPDIAAVMSAERELRATAEQAATTEPGST